MKKIIALLVFVAGTATSGYSQFIKQGTVIGGGFFEFQSKKNSDYDFKTSTVSLMPWAGYMVIDNVAVGALLNVSTQTSKSGGYKSTDTNILFGPVARYYLSNGLFAHGQFGIGSQKSKDDDSEDKYGASELRIGVGYAARITDTILFEPIVGYLSSSIKNKDTDIKSTDNGFFLMAGFTIFLHSTN
ncbi:hypothetical protein MASR2M41_12860 [Flammeovirgaceae bacterium]